MHTEVQFGIIIILASLYYYDYNGDDQINFKGSLQIRSHLKGFPVLLVTQLIRILSRNLKFPCTAVIYCSNYDCSATTMFDFTALLMIACGSVVM